MKVAIRYVNPQHGVVDATVSDDVSHAVHRVGRLPVEGWFCTCPTGKRCNAINTVKDVVVVMAHDTTEEAP